MAEGFEQYQVPNQTRRDKLRVNNNPLFCLHNNTNAAALLPLYDPSDLIHQSLNLGAIHMITPSSSSSNHMYYLNPQLSVQSNPNYNVQDISNSQTLCLSLSSYPLEMNLQRYAFVVKGSRFLKPAQVLLEEICDVVKGIYLEKNSADDLFVMESYPLMENLTGNYEGEQNRKKSRLISMLDEVYQRYKQYYQQIQAVITSFESISGLRSTAPLANMALKALSKHFIYLKNAISDQLQFTIKSKGETAYKKLELSSGRAAHGQRPLTGDNQPVWKPQRGLPERAVAVLRAWLFEHFLHPYPTDTDKLMLAKQTGLSRNQVSNWFINARVRLWKPMVEEMHMLETHYAQKYEQQNDHLATKSSFEEFPLNRSREDLMETSLPYDDFLHNPNSGVGMSNASGVSLTLGLHQNGVGLSESYTINAARRFGLETEQNGQFGRDIIGGQVPRDFVW